MPTILSAVLPRNDTVMQGQGPAEVLEVREAMRCPLNREHLPRFQCGAGGVLRDPPGRGQGDGTHPAQVHGGQGGDIQRKVRLGTVRQALGGGLAARRVQGGFSGRGAPRDTQRENKPSVHGIVPGFQRLGSIEDAEPQHVPAVR